MKKLMILAVSAIALVACSKTFDTSKSEGAAIGFNTWAETLTKAGTGRTIGGTEFVAGDYFFVYGNAATTGTAFDGDKVSASGSPLTWSYSPIRFWNRDNDYYDFYAISPSEDTYDAATSLVASHTVSTGAMTTVSLTMGGADNDILVADKKKVVKANYGEEVQLNFRHAAALLDLKVRKGAALGTNGVLKVTSATLENIDNIGTFSVASYNAPDAESNPNKANISWTATGHSGTYSGANGVKHTSSDIISSSTEVTTNGDQYLINNLVVMPQTFSASTQRLKITYTITTGTGEAEQTSTFTDKTYDLVLFDKTDYNSSLGTDPDAQNANPRVTGWVDGVHYTYIITIDAEAITFSATMQPWGTDNGYYYIIN